MGNYGIGEQGKQLLRDGVAGREGFKLGAYCNLVKSGPNQSAEALKSYWTATSPVMSVERMFP